MITMKIVVHQNRDTRQVINTDFVHQVIVLDTRSQRRSYTASSLTSSERNDISIREDLPRNRYNPYRKSFQEKEKEFDYRTKLQEKRALTTTRKKFAKLSVNVSTASEEESIESYCAEPSAIQLREPVLQFPRSNEKPTTSEVSSTSTEKPNCLTESLLEIYKCRMCPNFAVPEVYECPSGHSVCEECWLVVGQCTLCSDESAFRRASGMGRIAALLKFPCRWRGRGCSESLESAAWRDHVDSCRHAEVQSRPFVSAP